MIRLISHLKRKLKRKIISILTPIIGNLILIIIIVGMIYGTVELISGWWDSVQDKWSDIASFVTGESARKKEALNLYGQLGMEYEGLVYSKSIMQKLLNAPYTVNKEDINNKEITVEYAKESLKSHHPIKDTEITYPKHKVMLYYEDLSKYVPNWQILFAVNYLIDTFKLKSLSEEEIEEAFYNQQLNTDNHDEIEFIKVNKKRMNKIINDLKTRIVYEYKFDKSYYRYDQLLNNMPLYKTTNSYKQKVNTWYKYNKVKDTKLVPKVLPKSIKTCLYHYEYIYEYEPIATIKSGENYYLKKSKVTSNIDILIQVLEEYGFDESLMEMLIIIVEGLPEGEIIAQDLRASLYAYYNQDVQLFTPNIPHIEGHWSRDNLIDVAMILQGLDYFWGGKYPKKGANPDWGKLRRVTSAGSENTGKYLPLGMDCSGFVEWVYYQMMGYSVCNNGGSKALWSKSYKISRLNLKPGDLGFYQYGGGKHVGLYLGKIDGIDAFIHAGGSRWSDSTHPIGQVIVTKQYKAYKGYKSSEFVFFRRLPVKFKDDTFWEEE